MRHGSAWPRRAWLSMARHGTVWHGAAEQSRAQHSLEWLSVAQHSTVWPDERSTARRSSARRSQPCARPSPAPLRSRGDLRLHEDEDEDEDGGEAAGHHHPHREVAPLAQRVDHPAPLIGRRHREPAGDAQLLQGTGGCGVTGSHGERAAPIPQWGPQQGPTQRAPGPDTGGQHPMRSWGSTWGSWVLTCV